MVSSTLLLLALFPTLTEAAGDGAGTMIMSRDDSYDAKACTSVHRRRAIIAEGDHRVFDLRADQATVEKCNAACIDAEKCSLYSGVFNGDENDWCIGCDDISEFTLVNTATPAAVAYNKQQATTTTQAVDAAKCVTKATLCEVATAAQCASDSYMAVFATAGTPASKMCEWQAATGKCVTKPTLCELASQTDCVSGKYLAVVATVGTEASKMCEWKVGAAAGLFQIDAHDRGSRRVALLRSIARTDAERRQLEESSLVTTADDTSGKPVVCEENMHVSSNVCVACPAGKPNKAGDDASGIDTTCDGAHAPVVRMCSSFKVSSCSSGELVAEPSKTEGNSAAICCLGLCDVTDAVSICNGHGTAHGTKGACSCTCNGGWSGAKCQKCLGSDPCIVPIYRHYNSGNGDHVYTRNGTAPSGYVFEGIEFYAYADPKGNELTGQSDERPDASDTSQDGHPEDGDDDAAVPPAAKAKPNPNAKPGAGGDGDTTTTVGPGKPNPNAKPGAGGADVGDAAGPAKKPLPATKPEAHCAMGEMVSSKKCVVCPAGKSNLPGDDASGDDTSCDAMFCSTSQQVSKNKCVACPDGKTNDRVDDASGDDTSCEIDVCVEGADKTCADCPAGKTSVVDGKGGSTCLSNKCGTNECVAGNSCVPCPPGTTNDAGDDASGDDTSGEPIICKDNYHVSKNACVPCPAGSQHGGGDDASDSDTSCNDGASAPTVTTTTTTARAIMTSSPVLEEGCPAEKPHCVTILRDPHASGIKSRCLERCEAPWRMNCLEVQRSTHLDLLSKKETQIRPDGTVNEILG